MTNSFKNFCLCFEFEVFQKKAEALLRSSCKHKLANNSQVLVQKSQILLEILRFKVANSDILRIVHYHIQISYKFEKTIQLWFIEKSDKKIKELETFAKFYK